MAKIAGIGEEIAPVKAIKASAVAEGSKIKKVRAKKRDTGRHHGSRMDKGADRCGASHGIDEPYVQRNLSRFTDHSAEYREPRS